MHGPIRPYESIFAFFSSLRTEIAVCLDLPVGENPDKAGLMSCAFLRKLPSLCRGGGRNVLIINNIHFHGAELIGFPCLDFRVNS